MIFNTLQFFYFLPIAFILFHICRHRYRWIILLILSYVFYAGWKVEYLALIVYSTIIDYLIAIAIYRSARKRNKQLLVLLSLLSNLSLLLLFKYFHLIIGGSSWFKEIANDSANIRWLQFIFEYGVPVGISFYTFQTISYTIDVYRGKVIPEKNIGKFALFVSFFPQLVAGPIERFETLHHQLFEKFKLSYRDVQRGFRLMLYGFFLKLSVADNIGGIISPLFTSPENFDFSSRIFGTCLFGIQIFSDFYGYTLIAIGVAGLFGVKLQDNFKSPYGAYSIKEFWSRWHISLSTWFRDYIYIPLGGKSSNFLKWTIAILITFGISGLWHGSNSKFIWWGLLHGGFYLLEQTLFPFKNRNDSSHLERFTRWIVTLSIVMFGWLLFRANSMDVVANFFSSLGQKTLFSPSDSHYLFPLTLFILFEIYFRNSRIDRLINTKPTWFRWSTYSLLLLTIFLFNTTGNVPFIYFQF